jgi:hypothetical protein
MNIPIFDELIAELDAVTDDEIQISIMRTDEAAPDAERVGVLGARLLALGALSFKLNGRAANRGIEAIYHVSDASGSRALLAESSRLRYMAEMARLLLMGNIQDEHGWNEPTLTIRRDKNSLVLIKQESEKIPSMLLKLLKNAKPIDLDE